MGRSNSQGVIKILHVDDSRDYLLLAKARLSKLMEELSIDWAESGTDALKAMQSNDYNCVVCDFQMPDMDGMKLLETLRGEGDDTPFIFLSSRADKDIVERAKETGANGYCLKEFGPQNFVRLVNSIVKALRGNPALKRKLKKKLANDPTFLKHFKSV